MIFALGLLGAAIAVLACMYAARRFGTVGWVAAVCLGFVMLAAFPPAILLMLIPAVAQVRYLIRH